MRLVRFGVRLVRWRMGFNPESFSFDFLESAKTLCPVLTSETFRILERLLQLDRYRLSNSSRLDW
jgi:hypothetical protein